MAKTSNDFTIENFQSMRSDMPQFSAKNIHYSMSGVFPLYYKELNTTQEEQLAPLVPSYVMSTQSTSINGNITDIISISNDGTGTSGRAIVDVNNNVINGAASFAQPFGAGSNAQMFLADFAGNLIVSSSTSTQLAYMPYGASTYTLIGSGNSNTGIPRYLTPFLDFCAVTNSSKIYKLTSNLVSPSTTEVLDIGSGFSILAKPEVFDRYLSIPGAKTTSDYKNNYLFLWDGFGSRYQYNIPLPGKFIAQTNVFGRLYVLVEEYQNTQGLYQVVGTQLKKIRNMHALYTTRNSAVVGTTPKYHPMFNARGYVAVCTDSGLFLWRADETIGEVGFLYNTTNYSGGTSTGTYNYLHVVAGNTVYFDTTAGGFNNISYFSQYIPVESVSKLEIWYNLPPQSGTDTINVTLYGIDEYDPAGNLFNQTVVLNPITPTSYDSSKRTVLDCGGFIGKKMRIGLTTVNTGAWRPVIKKIIITQDK